MRKAVSMKVALVSMVLVGVILAAAQEAHAARPDEKPDLAIADAEPAIKAGDLRREVLQEANPYSRGCNPIHRCRG
ncbi:hypothetical protein E2562_036828 [Oryza meyeriana var. granulata]|uniref:Uncharacterized protein n=1 Tax=Oryza meyeriana var. granulata TaxID=110450 RepID=A0A6G1E8H4_9ORYZ|nr:hypothetical protein E2562_036828 [Oryza meyeriana var. granulata]